MLGKQQSYVCKMENFDRRLDVSEFASFVLAMGCDPVAEFAAVVSHIDTKMPR